MIFVCSRCPSLHVNVHLKAGGLGPKPYSPENTLKVSVRWARGSDCELCAARWKVPVLTAKSQVMQYSSWLCCSFGRTKQAVIKVQILWHA